MATRLKFRDYMLDDPKADFDGDFDPPSDPRCVALPFLWTEVYEEVARNSACGLNSLYALIGYASNFTQYYTHGELRLAAVLLWHRYKGALWLARKTG